MLTTFICRCFAYFLLLIFPIAVFAETNYEPNNTLETAIPFFVNEPAQAHKFDYAGDVDWLVFYAEKGTPYDIEIETNSVGQAIDPALTLYNEKGNIEVDLFNFNFAGEGELLSWNAPASGFYYIKVSNEEPEFNVDGHYKIKVFLPLAPLRGSARGEVLDQCTKMGLNKAEMSANKEEGTLIDQKLTYKTGGYSMPLLPGEYLLTARLEGYQSKTLSVTVQEAMRAALPFELLPNGGCDSTQVLKPHLGETVGVYDHVSGELLIKDMRIGDEIITAKLQEQDGFLFKLTFTAPLGKAAFDNPAFYDHGALLADIPEVLAFGRVFKVKLEQISNDFVFKISSAEPL